jgi:hypothetical protein
MILATDSGGNQPRVPSAVGPQFRIKAAGWLLERNSVGFLNRSQIISSILHQIDLEK